MWQFWCYLYLGLDECCYSYASVPRIDTFCVPYGGQVNLQCAIINPHDNFTNLTVTWFKSITEDISIFNEIPATSEGIFSSRANISVPATTCSHELYRDTFFLTIHRFNRNKNGYYWCQLSINDTLVQPSYGAQFSVGECNITSQSYYRLASLSERKCAQYVATESDVGLTSTYESSGTSSITPSTESSIRSSPVTQHNYGESDTPITYTATESDAELLTRSSSVTQLERENTKTIIYVAGSLGAIVLVFGALIIVLSMLYLCKFRNRETSKSRIIHHCFH